MSLKRKEDAFTGLEAAIVLIAFIVVAAVFSYVMLGAGFFTTQKSQETVFGAVGQATANMEVSGPVILKGKDDNATSEITFTIVLAAGGAPMDTNLFTYVVSSAKEYTELNATATGVNLTWYATGPGAPILERGDIVDVTITDNDALKAVEPNKPFMVEVKPAVGASLPIKRHAPLDLLDGVYYEVY